MKVLITGAGGQLGLALQHTFNGLGEIYALNRSQLDLSNLAQLRTTLTELKPQLVINAGAYTAVDKAESDQPAAWRINAEAPAVLAEETRKSGALLLHYSTDYVFAGNEERAYREQDPCAPLNQYGASKRAGEQAIEQLGGAYWILRTSWVYSLQSQNFLRSMLRLLTEREQLNVVADQVGAPTWTMHLAQASRSLVQHWLAQKPCYWGIYHACAAGETSWYGFACAIAQHLQAQGQRCATINPISTSQYPSAAQRPHNSRLDNSKLLTDYAIALPDWQQGLTQCLSTTSNV